MPHVFLSDSWLDEFEELTREQGGAMPEGARINLLITGGPDGDREVHVDDGTFGRGRLGGASTTLALPWEVAKAMFVEGDRVAVAQAWMSGRIKVEGDMAALMTIPPPPSREQADPFQERVRALTAD